MMIAETVSEKMSKQDFNCLGAMEIFVRVVELGSFSAAARALEMTPSAISKLIKRLEMRLGVRLLNRSTRQLHLTVEGQSYFRQVIQILKDIEQIEGSLSHSALPQGRIFLNSNIPFAEKFLYPILPKFLELYPQIQVDLTVLDTVMDLYENRTDIAIRSGPLKDSNLIATKLGHTKMIVVAAPDYLERHGTPRQPEELKQHNLLGFNFYRVHHAWPFLDQGNTILIEPKGNLLASNGQAIYHLTRQGAGIARLAAFMAEDDIKQGRLIPLLQAYNPKDIEEIHAVFMGRGGLLPARVRVFLDYLKAYINVNC